MKTSFSDVKKRQKVQAEVSEKKTYLVNGQQRYALKGKTADWRNLTKFVSKVDYEKATV